MTTTHVTAADNYVITPELEQAGLISYWRVADGGIPLTRLTDVWTAQRLDPKLLPSPPDDLTALGRAVGDLAEKRTLVRPLARRGAWMVVEETVLEDQSLNYRQLVKVTMGEAGPVVLAEEATIGECTILSERVARKFATHQGLLSSNDVTSWLVGLVRQQAKAVSLRDTGGVYFIPRNQTNFWRRVKTAVEATFGYNVFVIPAMGNAEAVAAITDAMTKEANDIVSKLQEELSKTGDEALGKRALASRSESVSALLTKLGEYEALLGRQLDVRGRITEVQATLTMLALTPAEGE